MTMEITYQLTKDDLLALAEFQIEASEIVGNQVRTRRYLYFVGFLLLAGGSFLIGEMILVNSFAILAILSFLFSPAISRYLISRRLPNMVEKKMGSGSLGQRTLAFSENGIYQIVGEMESKVPWSLVGDVAENPDHFFAQIDGQYTLVFPKAELDPKKLESIIEFIKKHSEFPDA